MPQFSEQSPLEQYDQAYYDILQVRLLQLVSELFPEIKGSSQMIIEEIGWGSYNQVMGVTIWQSEPFQGLAATVQNFFSRLCRTAKVQRSSDHQDYAIRFPFHDGNEFTILGNDMGRDVAVLQILQSCLAIPLPKVIKYDLGKDNALQKPYILQNRIRGQTLEVLMDTLNSKQMTHIVEKIAAITAPAAGMISGENAADIRGWESKLKQFAVPTYTVAEAFPDYAQPSAEPAQAQTPLKYLIVHCQRWLAYEASMGYSKNEALWADIIVVARSLDRLGLLGDCFHLVHDDLFPRNILAEVKDSTSVEIRGIIDWDISFFAPKCVAFRPPYWAWIGEDAQERDEGNARIEPEDDTGVSLQEAFLTAASDEYIRFGFSQEGVFARQLFYVVERGVLTPCEVDLANMLVSQWRTLYPSDFTNSDSW
ncbi:hypothetical protein BKA66DRAFT_433841 [Pyrenochaeta sp. MPI-SDFR-AT-0127]|nr:hypothetical protein BKA66DRAFT_433841 [Pyrenochaeta sp. MPI-SDFR-AT-0127]